MQTTVTDLTVEHLESQPEIADLFDISAQDAERLNYADNTFDSASSTPAFITFLILMPD